MGCKRDGCNIHLCKARRRRREHRCSASEYRGNHYTPHRHSQDRQQRSLQCQGASFVLQLAGERPAYRATESSWRVSLPEVVTGICHICQHTIRFHFEIAVADIAAQADGQPSEEKVSTGESFGSATLTWASRFGASTSRCNRHISSLSEGSDSPEKLVGGATFDLNRVMLLSTRSSRQPSGARVAEFQGKHSIRL